jgi:hypothetical protein
MLGAACAAVALRGAERGEGEWRSEWRGRCSDRRLEGAAGRCATAHGGR